MEKSIESEKESDPQSMILTKKYQEFLKDIASDSSFLDKLNSFYRSELEEIYFKYILLKPPSEIIQSMTVEVKLILAVSYSDECFQNKKLLFLLSKAERKITDELKTHYKILSKSLNHYSKQTKNYDEIDPNICLKNYRKHCCNSSDFAMHLCDKENKETSKFLIIKNKFDQIIYVICIKCKSCFFVDMINAYCEHCKKQYYTTILNEKEDANLLPATWKKYHCSQFFNDKMHCVKCKGVLYLNIEEKMLNCINKSCLFKCHAPSIDWTCNTCQSSFRSDAIVYNPLERKMIKRHVQDALIIKHKAHPSYVPCCKLNVFTTEFFHKKECKGILYIGNQDNNLLIICERCKAINFFVKFIWTCPKCLKTFKSKSIMNDLTKGAVGGIVGKEPFDNFGNNDKDILELIGRKNLNFLFNRMNNIDDRYYKAAETEIKILKVNNYNSVSNLNSNNLNINNFIVNNNNSASNTSLIKFNSINNNQKNIGDKYISEFNSPRKSLLFGVRDSNLDPKKNNTSLVNLQYPNEGIGTEIENRLMRHKDREVDKKIKIVVTEEIYICRPKEEVKEEIKEDKKEELKDYDDIKKNKEIPKRIKYQLFEEEKKQKEENAKILKEQQEKEKEELEQKKLIKERQMRKEKLNFRKSEMYDPDRARKEGFNDLDIKGTNCKVKDEIINNRNNKLIAAFSPQNRYVSNKNSDKNLNVKNYKLANYNKNFKINEESKNQVNNKNQAILKNKNNLNEKTPQKENLPKKEDNLRNNHIDKTPNNKNIVNQDNNINKNISANKNLNKNHKSSPFLNTTPSSLVQSLNRDLQKLFKKNKIPIFSFDEYTIIKRIGEGTYGFIYLVENKKTKSQYALKKLISNSLEEVESLILEFEILYTNNHPHIMKIYGIYGKVLDQTIITLYVLMEIAKCDWDEQIDERSKTQNYYKESELINAAKGLINALYFLQGNKISHRDIKPQNILIFSNSNFKLADFGEAKEVKISRQLNTLRGTELYMSPILYEGLKKDLEDVRHNSFKSDVYSLGLCFVFAASLNFNSIQFLRGVKDMKRIESILNRFLKKNYSEDFIKLLLVMLEYDENKRVDFNGLHQYIVENFGEEK